ncbi:MAG: acyl-CoA-binding protein [Flavobacterium sp.]
MTPEALDIAFNEAYEKASNFTIAIPPDVMLKLYAYYKHATFQNQGMRHIGENDLRNAFKMNALMQVGHLSKEEAKKAYIELVNELIK